MYRSRNYRRSDDIVSGNKLLRIAGRPQPVRLDRRHGVEPSKTFEALSDFRPGHAAMNHLALQVRQPHHVSSDDSERPTPAARILQQRRARPRPKPQHSDLRFLWPGPPLAQHEMAGVAFDFVVGEAHGRCSSAFRASRAFRRRARMNAQAPARLPAPPRTS